MSRKRTLVMLVLLSLLVPLRVYGASAIAMDAPETVVPGDEISVVISLPAGESREYSGTFYCDTQHLQLRSMEVSEGWEAVFCKDALTITRKSEDMQAGSVRMRFQVRNGADGMVMEFRYADVKMQSPQGITNVGTLSCETVLQTRVLPENVLTELEIPGVHVTPVFHSYVMDYTASVPYHISRLEVLAQAGEGVEIILHNPPLQAGADNCITATVSVPGAEPRVYTIHVWREAAPESSDTTGEESIPSQEETVQHTVPTKPDTTLQTVPGSVESTGVPAWVVITALLAGCALGAGIGILVTERPRQK